MDKKIKKDRENQENIDDFSELTGCPSTAINRVDTVADLRKRAGLPKEVYERICYVCKRDDLAVFKCGRCKSATDVYCSKECQRQGNNLLKLFYTN